jgi:hypothetical protein
VEEEFMINFEKIRNLLGIPEGRLDEQPVYSYINGDDLSENLYRHCIGQPLGFCLDWPSEYSYDFFEDMKVVNRCIESVISVVYKVFECGKDYVDKDASFPHDQGDLKGIGTHRSKLSVKQKRIDN